jgi:hypothetical protein
MNELVLLKDINLGKQEFLNRQSYYVNVPLKIGDSLEYEKTSNDGHVWFISENGDRLRSHYVGWRGLSVLKSQGYFL